MNRHKKIHWQFKIKAGKQTRNRRILLECDRGHLLKSNVNIILNGKVLSDFFQRLKAKQVYLLYFYSQGTRSSTLYDKAREKIKYVET